MYRTLIPVLLYTIAVAAAPQDAVNSDITYVNTQPTNDDNPPPKSPYRESRIENLPLTIPGNTANSQEKYDNKESSESDFVNNDTKTNDKEAIREELPDNPRKTRSEDTTAGYETDTVEPTELTTERSEELIQQTEKYEARTRAPSPRFLPKLSYFKKDEQVRSSLATNLVEKPGYRMFISKCRCEKDWNCPRLQITVPRCPTEYFLCC